MEPNERSKDKGLTIDRDAQINVTVNTPDSDEMTIDLGRVFHNMKVKRQVFAWVLVLCLVLGIAAPLMLYELNKPMLTVSSAVTLDYEVPMMATTYEIDEVTGARIAHSEVVTDEDGNTVYQKVHDLTAPDGNDLDLNLILSSSVLQSALNSMDLSEPVSLSALRNNIVIERMLTDDSRRAQELASQMVTDKNAAAYEQVSQVRMMYSNVFSVRLKNGFSENTSDDSSKKIVLDDNELKLLLDRILAEYNLYLVRTYADQKLPNDEISVVEQTGNTELLDTLEQLRTALDNLYDYCDERPDSVKEYRSYRDGRNLNDWMQAIRTGKETSVDYLYSYVYNNSIIKDRETMITNYQYQLQNAQTKHDTVSENIATTQAILDNYKNDEIYVSMQESDASKSTRTTTDYYNKLVLQQSKNYDDLAALETTIADLNDKIASLTAENATSRASEEAITDAEAELQKSIAACQEIYNGVLAHMKELTESTFYITYSEHTVPQGKLQNFLVANMKKMLIGAVAGIVIACGLWFLAGLAPEFRRTRKDDPEQKNGKEEAEA